MRAIVLALLALISGLSVSYAATFDPDRLEQTWLEWTNYERSL